MWVIPFSSNHLLGKCAKTKFVSFKKCAKTKFLRNWKSQENCAKKKYLVYLTKIWPQVSIIGWKIWYEKDGCNFEFEEKKNKENDQRLSDRPKRQVSTPYLIQKFKPGRNHEIAYQNLLRYFLNVNQQREQSPFTMDINQIPDVIQDELGLCPKKIQTPSIFSTRRPFIMHSSKSPIPIPVFPNENQTPSSTKLKPFPTRIPPSTTTRVFQMTKPALTRPKPVSIPTNTAATIPRRCRKDSEFYYQEMILVNFEFIWNRLFSGVWRFPDRKCNWIISIWIIFKRNQVDTSRREAVKYFIRCDERQMTFKDFLHLLNESKPFRDSLLNTLATSEFATYRWEMKELTQETYHQPVEFIIVDEPGLSNIFEDTRSFRSKTIRVEPQLSEPLWVFWRLILLRSHRSLLSTDNDHKFCPHRTFFEFRFQWILVWSTKLSNWTSRCFPKSKWFIDAFDSDTTNSFLYPTIWFLCPSDTKE